jgi:hypothetical protein
MTIVQVAIRDEPENVDNFLRACGATIDTSLPVEVMANRLRIPDSLAFHFDGLAPLGLGGATGVLVALDPDRRRKVEVQTWGCPSTGDAQFMRMRWVVPGEGAETNDGWRDTSLRLLEVSLRLVCQGVPDGWFSAAAEHVRWSQLLWFAADHNAGVAEPYGAIFASAEGARGRTPWQAASRFIGFHFLVFNGWVTTSGSAASLAPLTVNDPAFRDQSGALI